ncbi:MAG TPA: heparinase II/III family protein [Gemmatimonadaceae bacterium]
MSILISDAALKERTIVAAGQLAPLTASLSADLDRVVESELHFPRDKALLSREGGRCARDGTMLEFDPFKPHEHRCPRCGEIYRGDLHDRFWIYWYQLWLAERAVHGAVLSALGAGERYAIFAARALDGYAERYSSYPNVDNVLGPTRLFFSTYLESIWLLQICIATDLLASINPALSDRVRDRIIEPSRALISQYDEGASNRQVWNDVALLAAARSLGDAAAAEEAVYRTSGIASHLSNGLLADGTWYEGENYHLFAHRGLWYGVTMAELAGLELPAAQLERFELGFTAPFATALPDFTLPSRRDSQYAISLRQWRIAEHCELGIARHRGRSETTESHEHEQTLIAALSRIYSDDIPRHPTGRERSSADVERNGPATALTRADLSWRALLFARPQLPESTSNALASTLLESQGIAVFRRDEGRAYVAVDYGHSGGGHGHPDRLNLLLADGNTRWLDDFGTGSYVDPSLHWYRSTLAHNAPLFDGESQRRIHGELLAYQEKRGTGWIVAAVDEIARGVNASRAVIVMPSYVVDCVSWEADHETSIDIPMHADLAVESGCGPFSLAPITGRDGVEDGFRFLRDTSVQATHAGTPVKATATQGEASLTLYANTSTFAEWWRATAEGPPGAGDRTFRIVRARAQSGEHRSVWSWRGDVVDVDWGDAIRVTLADGTIHEHRASPDGWTVEMPTDAANPVIELGGIQPSPLDATPPLEFTKRPGDATLPSFGRAIYFDLAERHYRRSEQTWQEAGEPSASVVLTWQRVALDVVIDVPRSDRTFAARDAKNIYDNEPADVNGDGVELFIKTREGRAGWLLVPEPDSSTVRIRRVDGWNLPQNISARWERSSTGYRIFASLPAETPPYGFDVIVNEMPRGRLRRRGQLVLSGGAGEFVYLRGDRHEPERLITLRISDD